MILKKNTLVIFVNQASKITLRYMKGAIEDIDIIPSKNVLLTLPEIHLPSELMHDQVYSLKF